MNAIIIMLVMTSAFSALLVLLSLIFVEKKEEDLVSEVEKLLPALNCAQCHHPGCKPYASAMVNNNEKLDKCVPGGLAVQMKLAKYFNKPIISSSSEEEIVYIVEEDCIGCNKCAKICPYDAIIGTNKQMHTIVTSECTNCMLCIPVCPVDCIKVIKKAI